MHLLCIQGITFIFCQVLC